MTVLSEICDQGTDLGHESHVGQPYFIKGFLQKSDRGRSEKISAI